MGIVNGATVYECDKCGERFLSDCDVFVIDGVVEFSKKNFGGEVAIICPTCFLNKMFRETGKMEILTDVIDQYEEDEVEEDGELDSKEYDWGEMMTLQEDDEQEELCKYADGGDSEELEWNSAHIGFKEDGE